MMTLHCGRRLSQFALTLIVANDVDALDRGCETTESIRGKVSSLYGGWKHEDEGKRDQECITKVVINR